jgi:shikimate-5-dehydrogenase
MHETGQEMPPNSTRKFYLFGYNISHSLSPTIHNAGFKHTGFAGQYAIHETREVDSSVAALLASPDFGGASVTYPHKLQVAGLLDSVSAAAQKIGAINTISKSSRGELLGDNTDWSGIKACVDSTGISGLSDAPALVLGAGGAARAACYSLIQLGIPRIVVVNRTRANADAMMSSFPEVSFDVYETLDEAAEASKAAPPRVVIGCIPADDLTEDKIPAGLFGGAQSGVLVEMAYKPPVTGMEKAAAKHPGWRIFKGVDVLREQGYSQFSIWTGKEAPRETMSEAMDAELKRRALCEKE